MHLKYGLCRKKLTAFSKMDIMTADELISYLETTV